MSKDRKKLEKRIHAEAQENPAQIAAILLESFNTAQRFEDLDPENTTPCAVAIAAGALFTTWCLEEGIDARLMFDFVLEHSV